MSEQIQPRNSSFRKRPNFNNNDNNNINNQFLSSYQPEEKYKYENFEIQMDKKIGSGFLSKVYLSNNKIDNLQYAVKIINKKKVLNNGLSLDIIKNEIEIQERIIHPNIVRMYSHYEDEKNYYCFLEYINGPSLLNIMEQKKNGLTERETYKYFIQIIESIKFLHSNKIIHRDIKLENFLIQNQTIIKLIDFGCCALLTEDEPKRLSTCGTHLYMSPELINSQPYDYCVDIWALGVLFFELLHGYSPFGKRDDDYNIIYGNILIKKLKINKELTNNCLDLLGKMLEDDPEKRIDIFSILNHPWFKDWNDNDNNSFINSNLSRNDNQINKNDDDYFYNIMNLVEKKNGGKNKKTKKTTAERAKYEKRKNFHSQTKNNFHKINNHNNSVNEEKDITKNKKVNSLSNLNELETKNEQPKIEEKKVEQKIKPIKIEERKIEKKIEQPKMEEIKPLIIKKEPKIKQQILNNSNNNINSSRSGGKKDNIDFKVNEIIKNDSNDENTTENILNMLNNSKNKSNNKSNSSNSDEINTNYSHLMRKKEKENQKLNNNYNDSAMFRNNQTFKIVTRIHQNEDNDLKSTLQMFAKAEKLKQENEKIKLKTKEKSFWDKLFAPFKCGDD